MVIPRALAHAAILILATAIARSADWIERAIADLRDDDVRWNAYRAVRELIGADEPAARRALLAALDSEDHQQRHYAAYALRLHADRYSPWEGGAPSRLVEVSIEALGGDQIPFERPPDRPHRRHTISNGSSAFSWLLKQGRAVEPWLREGIDSNDPQRRMYSATLLCVALGSGATDEDTRRLVRLLAPHLESNRSARDASRTCNALARLGPLAAGVLREQGPTGDRQRDGLARMIISAIEQPPRTQAEVDELHRLQMDATGVLRAANPRPRSGWEQPYVWVWRAPYIDGRTRSDLARAELRPISEIKIYD